MLEPVYAVLDKVFGPLLVSTHPMWVVTISGIMLGAFFTLVNYFLVDQEKMRRLQKLSKEFQKEWKEAQKAGDEKKLRKLQQKQMELFKLQNEVMKDTFFKPMLITMPIFIVFFGWMRRWYFEVVVVKLPFNFFLADLFHKTSSLHANELGYIGWYILTSMVVGQVLRKVLDMA